MLGFGSRLRLVLRLGGTTRQLLLMEIASKLGLGLGLGLVLGCFGVGDRVFLLEPIKID